MEFPRESKIIEGSRIDLGFKTVAVHQSIALPLQVFQACMLWMEAFDENNRLIGRYRMLRASYYGCFMPLDVDLEKVNSRAMRAFIIDGDE
jgi:hypothetical protein